MHKVLIFGDSLVTGLEFEESLEFTYLVESYPGWLARDIEKMLEITLKEDEFTTVVLCFGINDLGHGYLPQEVVTSLLKLHEIILNKYNVKNLIAVNLLNFYLFNELYGEQSVDEVCFSSFFYDLEEGDLKTDKLHLSKKGRCHFAESLQTLIENE